MGIDLNPNRIGVSVYYDGKVIQSESFELTSEDQNERRNEISHFCDSIYKLMKHYGISHLGMEDLSLKSHRRSRQDIIRLAAGRIGAAKPLASVLVLAVQH